jgi:hypothetical protein
MREPNFQIVAQDVRPERRHGISLANRICGNKRSPCGREPQIVGSLVKPSGNIVERRKALDASFENVGQIRFLFFGLIR